MTARRRAWGALEDEVLRLLRAQERPVSAQELRAAFDEGRPAYSTVMTALDRLHRKGLVVREADSPRKVRFAAARPGHEHASSSMLTALTEAPDRQAALLSFAGNLAPEDVEVLRRALGTQGQG